MHRAQCSIEKQHKGELLSSQQKEHHIATKPAIQVYNHLYKNMLKLFIHRMSINISQETLVHPVPHYISFSIIP